MALINVFAAFQLTYSDGSGEQQLLGVYASRGLAEAAVGRQFLRHSTGPDCQIIECPLNQDLEVAS